MEHTKISTDIEQNIKQFQQLFADSADIKMKEMRLGKGKNTQDIDVRHEAQQMAQDQVEPIYEQIYQDMVKLMDANTKHGDKLEKILTMWMVKRL